jgi:hypothetical protein
MIKLTLIPVLFLMDLLVHAQDFGGQRRSFIAANIGINGMVGGIGALTNKKKEENSLKIFLKVLVRDALAELSMY